MYQVTKTDKFLKTYNKLENRYKDRLDLITKDMLITDCNLQGRYKDHKLSYNLAEYRELHISGDILLLYTVNRNQQLVTYEDILNHKALKRKSSELFSILSIFDITEQDKIDRINFLEAYGKKIRFKSVDDMFEKLGWDTNN